jgi:lantibiotic modifying enzyme
LRAYQILTDEKNLNDSLAALQTAVRSVTELNTIRRSNFSLCHGLAGICDLLLYATSILKDEKYKSVATNIGLYGIDKYSSLGSN